MYCYKIGDIYFIFKTEKYLVENSNFGLFRINPDCVETESEKVIFDICSEDSEPDKGLTLIFKCSSYSVYTVSDTEFVKITNRFDEHEYKCICRQNESGGEISFTNGGYECLKTTAELFRVIDFVTALLIHDGFVLHASVIEKNGKAYIFTGPSGIGKSTQADLWQKYNGARVLNGDRVLIRKSSDGKWKAYGFPFCGSSNCCEDFKLEIGAVFSLKQSKENRVVELDAFSKLNSVISQVSCGNRKKQDSILIFKILESFLTSNKISEFYCTPDENAVKCLSGYLFGSD